MGPHILLELFPLVFDMQFSLYVLEGMGDEFGNAIQVPHLIYIAYYFIMGKLQLLLTSVLNNFNI